MSGGVGTMSTLIEQIRSEVARVLDQATDKLEPDRNMIEIGLHSLAIMQVIGPLSALAGIPLDYADLARRPTLAAWQALIERAHAQRTLP